MVLIGLQTTDGTFAAYANFGPSSAGKTSMGGDSILDLTSADAGKTWTLKWTSSKANGKFISVPHGDGEQVSSVADGGDKSAVLELDYDANGFASFWSPANASYLGHMKSGAGEILSAVGTPTVKGKGNPPDNCKFMVVLTILPQTALQSKGKFLSCDASGKLECRRPHQFGTDSVFVFEKPKEVGHYVLKGPNGKYLSAGSKLAATADSPDDSCKMSVQFVYVGDAIFWRLFSIAKGKVVNNSLAFTEADTAADKVNWTLEASSPQFSLRAKNGKFVSVQGENVGANKDSINMDDKDTELFAFQPNGSGYSISFPTSTGEVTSWQQEGSSLKPVQGAGSEWTITYKGNKVSLCANGKYLKSTPIGGMNCGAASNEDELTWFELCLSNRPELILQDDSQKFVGPSNDGKKVTHHVTPHTCTPVFVSDDAPFYHIKSGDQYWVSGASGTELGDKGSASKYFFELDGKKLKIKTEDGQALGIDNKDIKPGAGSGSWNF